LLHFSNGYIVKLQLHSITPDKKLTIMTLAENIKAARIAAKLTRKELSQLIPCSAHTVKGWELGRHAPSKPRKRKLEELLNLKPQTLSYEPPSDKVHHENAINALSDAIMNLAPEKKKETLSIIIQIVKLIS